MVLSMSLPADPFATDAPLAPVAPVRREVRIDQPVAPRVAVCYPVGERVWHVHSGGQSGADQGALRGAQAAGVPTKGWAPRGWATEKGPAPWLATWGLREHTGGYPERTAANVESTDATIIVGDRNSRGSLATIAACKKYGRPFVVVAWVPGCDNEPRASTVDALKAWLRKNRVLSLNVAGNRESIAPGIGEATYRLIAAVLTHE